ncbi:MAG: glycosyltransferase family 4 protein, partial [Fibrobacteraceae bacterium]|nr:glycosyltransferase family 4 protein [Fibrobacteraceae bacterium]
YGSPLSSVPVREVHPRSGRYRTLFGGRHIERKGIEYLIEAAAKLDPSKFEIRIVGKGNLTDFLKDLAKKVSPKNIVFTGPLSPENLKKEYLAANCFVLPAIVDARGDTEGLGVVLIEAMEYGLPVVASNVGGISDAVIDKETGLLVPEKNPSALAEAFKTLEASPELEKSLLTGAQKRIAEEFDWKKIAEKQIAIYKRIAKQS